MLNRCFAMMVLMTCTWCAPEAFADEGNGQGTAFLSATPIRIGGVATVTWGVPGLPFAQTALVISDSPTPTMVPGLGSLCINTMSPGFSVLFTGSLNVAGQASLSSAIPNLPSLVSFPPSYLLAVVVDFSLPTPFLSVPKTIAVYFENNDSYTPPAVTLSGPRALHTATSLGVVTTSNRTRILVAGGGNGTILAPTATNTTEIYSPLTRTFTPGPNMNVDRAQHQSLLLDDGRVLIIGGTDTAGAVTATCQLYDPATNTLSMAASLTSPRAGHAATKLPNGRILVTGGVTTFVGGSTMLAAILNTAQNTGEVYNPLTNTWTPVPGVMASRRFGHNQVLLNSGSVLIAGGINGGANLLFTQVPTYTATCNVYDPNTNTFSVTGNLSGARAGLGMSVLANGNVLATGGIISGVLSVPTVSATCQVWSGATWSTSGVAQLPSGGAALHTQVALPNGTALIQGGLTGTFVAIGSTALVGVHDGALYSARAQIGTNPGIPGAMASPRGSHTTTRLYDGSFFVIGGTDGTGVYSSSFVYTPAP